MPPLAPSILYDPLPLAVPVVFLMLLVHRSGGLPTGLFVGGVQFIIVLVQRSSVILATCHFNAAKAYSEHTAFHSSLSDQHFIQNWKDA